MVFTSITFLFVFLPVCLAGYMMVGTRLRNLWLLVWSLLFYAWGSGALVGLLLASTAIDYLMGMAVAVGRRRGDRGLVRLGVTVSVIANLGMLAYFKYANFFVSELNRLEVASFDVAAVALPVGISFYTFQSMSYTIDIARGRAEHLRNPIDFGLYVVLFPQLVAGPIVRFHEIAAQLAERTVSVERFSDGAVRFTHGLAKKVLIADSVAPIADAAFSGSELSAGAAWLGIIAYTIQIYFDFSGYSDMAIGLGLMLGFDFPENFRRPYSAVSITDFWRRWHITLSNWFRDYLYIPLGGSRRSELRTYANLSLVFLLTGIWHGANWTFVVWGLFHGVLLIGERLTGQRVIEADRSWTTALRRAYTLLAVMAGWVFFRSPDVGLALDYLAAMVTPGGSFADALAIEMSTKALLALTVGVLAMLLPRTLVTGPALLAAGGRQGQAARVAVVYLALPFTLLIATSSTFSPFLYFQF